MTMVRHTVVVAAMCLLFGSLVEAQTTGTIEGTVTDGRGLPVAGVTVTARHIATDTPYRVTTNELGQYRFSILPPGTFEVTTAASSSLGPGILTVKVTMGETTTANFDPTTPVAELRERTGRRRSGTFEASGRLGWTFTDGVSSRLEIEAGDGNVYDRIDPADSVSWGFTLGVFLTSHLEVEFLFDRQESTLQLGGTSTIDIGDMGIGNYHGVLSYNFGDRNRPVRVYAFGGAGITTYGSVTFTGPEGETRETSSSTRLSGTMGGGVKIYRGAVGARLEARFTPTYIKSTADGWWCDDYWGCYLIDQLHYSKQFEFSGGVTVRF
jgi:hypothetical protein